jgi:putative NIF3 family GTP cyclohydrolase 1 type 2
MHTNADAAAEGLNTALAALIGLTEVRALEPSLAAPGHGMGAIGLLDPPMPAAAFLAHLKERLGMASLRATPHDAETPIRRVAVCGGAGGGYASAAIAAGADAFVTADLSYHAYQDARDLLLLVDAGHYETERIFIETCAGVLRRGLFESSEKSPIFPSVTNTNAMVIV